MQCKQDLSTFWTTLLTTCNSYPMHNCWFMLNTSYDHGCHLASQFCLEPNNYKVVLPLVVPSSCHLVVSAGCHIASCCPLIAPPSFCLVAPAGCCIASCHPLIAPPSCPLFSLACCHIAAHDTSTTLPLYLTPLPGVLLPLRQAGADAAAAPAPAVTALYPHCLCTCR